MVSLGYFVLGWASLKLATINENASPIWIPSGFGLGCLLLFGVRFAPAVFFGAFLTNATVNTSWTGLVTIGTGNTIEAILGFFLVKWILEKKILKEYSEFYAVLVTSLFASIMSATIGVMYLFLDGIIPFNEIDYSWYTWWSGDAIGILVILPFFMQFYICDKFKPFSAKRILFGLLLTIFLFYIVHMVFVKGHNLAFAWSLTPILILAGFLLGHFLSRTILILVTFYIVYLTTKGYTPYDYGNLNLNLIYAQSLLTSFGFAILFVRPFSTGFSVGLKFILGTLVAWAAIFLIIATTFKYEKTYTHDDFNRQVLTATENFQKNISQVELLMNVARSLVSLKPDITAEEWKSYVFSLNLPLRYKHVDRLGLVFPTEKINLPTLMTALKKRGSRIVNIKVIEEKFSEKYTDAFIIGLTEPEFNYFALGLDLGSEQRRREAAEKARYFNTPHSTSLIQLLDSNEKGFLIFQPILDQSDRFLGWVYAPVNAQTFFGSAFHEFGHVLRLKISNHKETVFTMNDESKDNFKNHSYVIEKKVVLFGAEYSIDFYPTARFFNRHSGYSAILALMMNLFMLFMTGFLLDQKTFGQRTEALVQERTKELENSKMQLVHSSKMASLGEMASGMAHEINNPLTIIMGKIKMISLMLEEDRIMHPLIHQEMDRMRVTTERIGKIVKGLRSFSRVSDFDPFEEVYLGVIVQETMDLCLEKFKAKGIQVRIGEIPKVVLNCRPSQISQVLLNLLSNGFDAVKEIGPASDQWIELSFELKAANHLQILIKDSGAGIPLEIIDRIMDPFFTTKEPGKGTGLGLSIAKGIIEDHGGKITVDTNSKNTCFMIELPYQRSV
jgi:signal transduction histidine kinase/integral membrane sensor domain MASE1